MAMSVVYATINGQIVSENRGGVISYYAPDNLGSTVALLDTTGTVTDTFTYWPYGEMQNHVGSSVTPFTFCGTIGYYLDVLGSQIYVKARYLRQSLARWQTLDPGWPRQGAYNYVASSPISLTDSTGLFYWNCYIGRTPNLCKWFYNNIPDHTDSRLTALITCLGDSQGQCNYPTRYGSDPSSAINEIVNNMGGPGISTDFQIAYGGNSGLCAGKCAWTNFLTKPATITICADGYNGNGCGTATCLILHEILHVPGMTHKSDNEDAFQCLNSAFGCNGTPREVVK
jgi:RHS repeat-associated protein